MRYNVTVIFHHNKSPHIEGQVISPTEEGLVDCLEKLLHTRLTTNGLRIVKASDHSYRLYLSIIDIGRVIIRELNEELDDVHSFTEEDFDDV